MKKDKEWLKEKADRLFFDNSISNNPYLVAKREAITEISNLIDQLDEPETERDVVVAYFSPFTDLPVMVETETHKYMIEVTKIIEKEEQ